LAKMTDPSDALTSFQQALRDGLIEVHAGTIDPELYVHLDHPNGTPRFTYGRHKGDVITALVVLAMCEPIDGVPCFQIGYAVPEDYRSQGRAKSIVDAAIAELKHGLGRNKIDSFYVEAIVGVDNEASKRVATTTISTTPVAVTDKYSGLPALQYLRKV
jgi:hypothetical protein